jgi:hypothetical protein
MRNALRRDTLLRNNQMIPQKRIPCRMCEKL